MRAPGVEPSPEIVDLAIERTGSSRAVDEINRAKPRLARQTSKGGKADRQKLIAEIREGRPQRAKSALSVSVADAVSAQGKALAETRTELAGVRAQMAELEAERGRVRAQFFRLTQDRHDTERSSLEHSLKSLGDQFGSALAELGKASIELERARTEAAEISGERDRARGEAAEISGERDKARAEARELRDRVARLEAQVSLVSNQLASLSESEAKALAEIRRKEELRTHFIDLAARLLGGEVRPTMSELDVLAKVRERLRRLERKLDQAEAAEQRVPLPRTADRRLRMAIRLRSWRVLFGHRIVHPREA
jgi:chromosome segregation ATPase